MNRNARRGFDGSLTEHAQSVVHGHHDHVAVGGEDAGVKHVPGALHVRAAVNEQHDGLLPAIADICAHKTHPG